MTALFFLRKEARTQTIFFKRHPYFPADSVAPEGMQPAVWEWRRGFLFSGGLLAVGIAAVVFHGEMKSGQSGKSFWSLGGLRRDLLV